MGKARDFHAQCVKISLLRGNGVVKTLGFLQKEVVAPGVLKSSQIRLTLRAVSLEFADCYPKKNKKHEEHTQV
ncbi:MAG: hypothetical protein JWR19_2670 [Pedosphaera sp.]|nr:hypothetical protein [Pedosphaera sp.]